MRNKSFLVAATILGSTLLAGCSTTLKVPDTHAVSIPEAALAPSAEELTAQISGHGKKIIITPVEYRDSSEKIFADEAYDDLSQRVMKSGNTVVDRSLAAKLKGELLAAEKSGRFRTSGPAIADVAIMPKIAHLSYGKSFHKAQYWTDDKGVAHKTDAYCSYSGSAKMYVRAYKIPSMELINTYEYDGSSSNTSQTNNSSCPLSSGEVAGIISQAFGDAVKSGSPKTLNDLAPDAYVIERRDATKDASKALFFVTITKKSGAVEGAKVKFFRLEKHITPITNESRIEPVLLGEGEMTSAINTSGSYVQVDDKKLISEIKVGDIAKIDHGKCSEDESEVFGSCVKLPKLF